MLLGLHEKWVALKTPPYLGYSFFPGMAIQHSLM